MTVDKSIDSQVYCLNNEIGTPCDIDGYDLPPGSAPPLATPREANDYFPFQSHAQFEVGEFLFVEEEMSAGKIDRLLLLLRALYPNDEPPVNDHKELYAMIDAIEQGDVAWSSFSVSYNGELPDTSSGATVPPWMTQKFEVWFRDPLAVLENQIGNPDFKAQFDYAPKRVFRRGKRRFRDLMSGNWAWKQAVSFLEPISVYPSCKLTIFQG